MLIVSAFGTASGRAGGRAGLADGDEVEQRAGLARGRPLHGQKQGHHERVAARRVAQQGGRRVGERRAASWVMTSSRSAVPVARSWR
jgi:hypothetical protein